MAVKRYDHLVDLAYALLAEPLEDRHLDVEFDLLAGARRLEQALCGRTFDCFAEFESIGLNSARELKSGGHDRTMAVNAAPSAYACVYNRRRSHTLPGAVTSTTSQ